MRMCWPASRCTFDTQWDVFSKQQEMADADGAQLPLLWPDHAMLMCVCVCVCVRARMHVYLPQSLVPSMGLYTQ